MKHPRLPLIYHAVSRRMLLKGATAGLALPFLPSLDARAQASTPKYFVFAQGTHGRAETAWYPQAGSLQEAAPGVRATPLSALAGPLGDTLRSDFDDLRSKISLVQGVDFPSAWNTHDMFPLTASGRMESGPGGELPNFHYSVDTVLSESSQVYPAPVPIPVLRLNPRVGGSSFSFLGTAGDGMAKRAPALGRTLADTWNAIQRFIAPAEPGAPSADTTSLKRKYLLDQSLSEFNSVLASPELGQKDKILLQNYADQLHELEKRLSVQATPVTADCTASLLVDESVDNDVFNQRLIDMMTLAMACGVTRIATYALNWDSTVSSNGSVGYDLFHDVVHSAHMGGYEQAAAWGNHSLKHFGYMVRKFDEVGLLDKSCLLFTSDYSSSTDGHHGADMPLLTAGTLGGTLRAGEWIDFRNLSAPIRESANVKRYGGRRINELWVSLFKAAGLTAAEYERMGVSGFGEYECLLDSEARCGADTVKSLVGYYQSYAQPRDATLHYLFA